MLGQGKGWEALDEIWDVTGASWLDVDDDVGFGYSCFKRLQLTYQGSLDIMIQRSGDQGAGKISFIQNNFYHDAFFLKAQGMFCQYTICKELINSTWRSM